MKNLLTVAGLQSEQQRHSTVQNEQQQYSAKEQTLQSNKIVYILYWNDDSLNEHACL